MADKKPELSLEQQVKMLSGQLGRLQGQIEWMQKLGGFTDAKTLGMRSTRLEQRVEKVESAQALLKHDTEMLKDLSGHVVSFCSDHLVDRHGAKLVMDNQLDVHAVSKMKRRLREWAEARGLIGKKQSDVPAAAFKPARIDPALMA